MIGAIRNATIGTTAKQVISELATSQQAIVGKNRGLTGRSTWVLHNLSGTNTIFVADVKNDGTPIVAGENITY